MNLTPRISGDDLFLGCMEICIDLKDTCPWTSPFTEAECNRFVVDCVNDCLFNDLLQET